MQQVIHYIQSDHFYPFLKSSDRSYSFYALSSRLFRAKSAIINYRRIKYQKSVKSFYIRCNNSKDVKLSFNNMKHADIDKDLLVDLNDSGYTFDEIADYLDRVDK